MSSRKPSRPAALVRDALAAGADPLDGGLWCAAAALHHPHDGPQSELTACTLLAALAGRLGAPPAHWRPTPTKLLDFLPSTLVGVYHCAFAGAAALAAHWLAGGDRVDARARHVLRTAPACAVWSELTAHCEWHPVLDATGSHSNACANLLVRLLTPARNGYVSIPLFDNDRRPSLCTELLQAAAAAHDQNNRAADGAGRLWWWAHLTRALWRPVTRAVAAQYADQDHFRSPNPKEDLTDGR